MYDIFGTVMCVKCIALESTLIIVTSIVLLAAGVSKYYSENCLTIGSV